MRAASSGSAETRPIIFPGWTTSPECSSTSVESAGGSATGRAGSFAARSTSRIPSIRFAPTYERVSLSTASAAVRSGSTRKAAYP